MAHPDGTIYFRADRNKWVAVMDGYQMAARNTAEACKQFLINKRFTGTIVIIPFDGAKQLVKTGAAVPTVAGDSIQDWIRCEARATVEQANNLFGLTLAPNIEFCAGRAAGWARGTSLLRFNTILAAENKDTFHQTIKHEVAHLVVNAKYGHMNYRTFGRRRAIRPHGPEFMNTLVHLGGRPERCHSMDTTNAVARNVKRFAATCGCKTYMLTAIRVRRGVERYHCKKCGNTLKLVGK